MAVADERVFVLSQEIHDINIRLQKANQMLESGRPMLPEARRRQIQWRTSAVLAKEYRERELSYVKHWIKTENQKLREFAELGTVNPQDPLSLLAAARKILVNVKTEEDIELFPEEEEILSMIERRLGFAPA